MKKVKLVLLFLNLILSTDKNLVLKTNRDATDAEVQIFQLVLKLRFPKYEKLESLCKKVLG